MLVEHMQAQAHHLKGFGVSVSFCACLAQASDVLPDWHAEHAFYGSGCCQQGLISLTICIIGNPETGFESLVSSPACLHTVIIARPCLRLICLWKQQLRGGWQRQH